MADGFGSELMDCAIWPKIRGWTCKRGLLLSGLRITFGVQPLGGTAWEPPKGGTPNLRSSTPALSSGAGLIRLDCLGGEGGSGAGFFDFGSRKAGALRSGGSDPPCCL